MTKQQPGSPRRRAATVEETKALAHPLRIRILRLCRGQELTNKQLAEELNADPGTVLHHVRVLVGAGFLEQGEVRSGRSGALEKPYRSTGASWWLDNPLGAFDADTRAEPIRAFAEEFERAGPQSLAHWATFVLHLSDEDLDELDRRIAQVLDEYVRTDEQRSGAPLYSGMYLLHRRGPQDGRSGGRD